MAIAFEVSGDDLCVTRDRTPTRLSLVVPMARVQTWLDQADGNGAAANHPVIRDQVMPAEAREFVVALEQSDGVAAFAVTAHWSDALRVALGKALLLPDYIETTEQPSPPTSGSDSASGSTPRPRTRRSKSSPATS